jgi:hypothetical protein
MIQTAHIRPVNSLVFVSDTNGGEVPEWVRDGMVWSTSSCIAIVCYPEQDGPTDVILGNAAEVDPGGPPLFDGHLEVPNRTLVVSTVDQQTVMQADVLTPTTRLRVWTNHPRWPDKVTIGVG